MQEMAGVWRSIAAVRHACILGFVQLISPPPVCDSQLSGVSPVALRGPGNRGGRAAEGARPDELKKKQNCYKFYTVYNFLANDILPHSINVS